MIALEILDDDQEPPLPKFKKLKLQDDDDSSFAFQNPSKRCLHRIHSDLQKLYQDPIEGIFVVPDDDKANRCHAIILGPSETPYEYGYFYFLLDFPDQYPHVPPRVILQTTGGGTVRFNPNLYSCGKVCLSILGTWNGPSWTPALNIGSVLLSIQSLMNSFPYHNEPGFESVNRNSKEPRNYNHIIRHETIRVAVLGMVQWALTAQQQQPSQQPSQQQQYPSRQGDSPSNNSNQQILPEKLADLVVESFRATSECCQYLCDEYKTLDGKAFQDPYQKNKGTFHFRSLQRRLKEMEQQVSTTTTISSTALSISSSSSISSVSHNEQLGRQKSSETSSDDIMM